jgi:hypothetical protein
MAMTYTQLVADKSTSGSIARWVNDSTIDSATIVLEAEAFIYRRLRHRLMTNDSATGSMVIGQDNVLLPLDHIDTRKFIITGGVNWGYSILKKKILEDVWREYSYDATGARQQGAPTCFYTNPTQVKFNNAPDQAYSYQMAYYAQLTPLATSLTNFITATYPRLMRCACMIFASEFIKDSGQGQFDRTYWTQQALSEIQAAQAESDNEESTDIVEPEFV